MEPQDTRKRKTFGVCNQVIWLDMASLGLLMPRPPGLKTLAETQDIHPAKSSRTKIKTIGTPVFLSGGIPNRIRVSCWIVVLYLIMICASMGTRLTCWAHGRNLRVHHGGFEWVGLHDKGCFTIECQNECIDMFSDVFTKTNDVGCLSNRKE